MNDQHPSIIGCTTYQDRLGNEITETEYYGVNNIKVEQCQYIVFAQVLPQLISRAKKNPSSSSL
jgi:hypothetical protein